MEFDLRAEHLALVLANREVAFKVKELPIPKPGLGNTSVPNSIRPYTTGPYQDNKYVLVRYRFF